MLDPMYPLPKNRLAQSMLNEQAESEIQDQDNPRLRMTVRAFEDIGWELEVRYDEAGECRRQIFTGAQERLPLAPLSYEKKDNATVWNEPGGTNLSIDHLTGVITLFDTEGEYWKAAAPFSSHAEPVNLYENIMSQKVTNFSEFTALSTMDAMFATRMTRFQYPLPQSGPVLGLPGQTGEFNRRDYRFQLYNTDMVMHTPERPPMYQSWPILFHFDERGSGWICIFHDNPSRTFVDIGDFYSNTVTFESLTGNTRVYILHDKTLKGVSEKITRLLGGCPMPPEWSFGYQQSRWSYLTADEIKSVADRFRSENIPCDAIYFDIDYMDGYRVFSADPKRFANMRECLDDLHDKGFKAICIQDPGVKIDPEYEVYKKVEESKRYLKNDQGTAFVGTVWPGKSIYPDFGSSELRQLWGEIQTGWIKKYPFDGIWNDMNEPSNFEGQNRTTSNAFTERGPLSDEWNLYGYYMAQASREGMKVASPDKPTLVITRAGYAGVQQHAIIWHGDNQAWWEHLRLSLHTALSYALCGAQYTGPDVPGFSGNPPDDLAIRFFQLGSWLPLFRGHSIYFAKDKEPYTFSPETRVHIEAAINQRYSLAEEWIEGFRRSTSSNFSPMLPVFDKKSHPVQDQFQLFEKFVVAPVMERNQTKKLVYLPEGMWHSFADPSAPALEGKQWHMIDVDLSSVPVFVKAGNTVAFHEVRKNIEETLASPRTEKHFG